MNRSEWTRAVRSVLRHEIDDQRARGWPDFHPEDYCHRCGQRNVHAWHIDSDVWNSVVGGAVDAEWQGIMCPQCFTELYEAKHGSQAWELRLDRRPAADLVALIRGAFIAHPNAGPSYLSHRIAQLVEERTVGETEPRLPPLEFDRMGP